jgi:hypothetical protein
MLPLRRAGSGSKSQEKELGGSAFTWYGAAVSIGFRAEDRAGQMLTEMAERGERKGGAHGGNRKSSSFAKLEDLAVTKAQSHRWQMLAS